MSEAAPPPIPAGPTPAGTCYRHPDRHTYIRCTRCDRSICPECMRPAPVGFQCPECVGEAARTVRQPVTVSGGRLVETPYLTYSIIALNAVVFGFQFLLGVNDLANEYGMWPFGIALNDEWYRLITAAFLHGSILHIGFNMLVLFSLGPTLERVLGHARFLVLYLVAALGGSVASYMFSDPRTVSVGASGAIFGLMGALVVAGRRLRWDITQVLMLLAVNVVIGFLSPGVDWRAHLGGLIVGGLVAGVFVWTPPPLVKARIWWQVLGVLGIVGILVVLTMWRTGELVAMASAVG